MPPADPTTDSTIPIQRAQAFVGLAMQRGWDIEAMLGTAGISPLLLAEGRSRITANQFGVLFRQLWRETDDELLGLGLEPVPRRTFGCSATRSSTRLTWARRYDGSKTVRPSRCPEFRPSCSSATAIPLGCRSTSVRSSGRSTS